MGIRSDVLAPLEASLDNAKAGLKEAEKNVVFFTGQIGRLNETIAAVKKTLTAEDDQGVVTKTKAAAKSGLPRTGNEFWLALITDKPQKTGEILDAACDKLKVTSDEDRKTLKNRQNFSLNALVEAKSVHSEGSQQNRVFLLPKKS